MRKSIYEAINYAGIKSKSETLTVHMLLEKINIWLEDFTKLRLTEQNLDTLNRKPFVKVHFFKLKRQEANT